MEVKARLNYLKISPRKLRLAADLIKGLDVKKALLELRFLSKRSALPLQKLLLSAVANAKHNFQIPEDTLYIKDLRVNQGPILKRFMPRAFGRAAPIRKRSSHIFMVLDTKTPASGARPRKVGKVGPIVREVSREDIKDEFLDEKPKGDRQIEREKPRPKAPGFVRRVFKRKVI